MKRFITEYANEADHGAPYVGPILLALTWTDAERFLNFIRGPNNETLSVVGELIDRMPADVTGDTFTITNKDRTD